MADSDRAGRVFAAWYEAREMGAAASPSEFLAAHPEIAESLRARLLALDLIDDALTREHASAPDVLGPYRLRRALGTGGMGSVYLAEVRERSAGHDVGTHVAIKLLHPHLLERTGFFRRFLREADIGRRVEHDNVVRTYTADALVVDGRSHHFLVMEYVEGKTLGELVHELDRLPESLCRHVAIEIAKGLGAIHAAGAVHRDLKPDNVLITDDHVVKVMDLGVAHLADETLRLSQTGAFVGSLSYAAPEQFGGGSVDARADLHALGVLLYEVSSGVHPYDDDDARSVMRRVLSEPPRPLGEVNPQLSPFFEELVHTLLAKSPDERFESAKALLGVLEEAERSEWWRDRARALRHQTEQPLRRIRIPRETAVYGRDPDLDRLSDLYREANAGDGRVLLLEGEAGVGKTRLVDEFVARLAASGEAVHFLFASYPPGGAATASGAFSAAYREYIGERDLKESVARLLPDTPLLVPGFAALLCGDAAPAEAVALTKDSLQTCFVHATRSLAAERTTIVLIDDLHFAPDEGRALFMSLALAAPGHRILLVGTMRPGLPAEWIANVTRLDQTTHSVLERLGPKDLFELLKDSFRSERLADELGMRITVKSDGNPFFVFEIIRGLRDGQFLRRRPDGTWETTQVIDAIEVPSSVVDLVNARVSELSERERALLDVAACWGFEFDPVLIGAVLEIGRIPALRALAHLESRHRLVRSAGRRFVFDHHQVQETLYEALPELLREEYHAALADALEQRDGAATSDVESVDPQVCVELSDHYIRGARPRDAMRYLPRAARHLRRSGSPGVAAGLCDSLLRVPGLLTGVDRLDTISEFATAARICGNYVAAAVRSREACELASAEGDDARELSAQISLSCCLLPSAQHTEAQDSLRRALELARRLGDRVGEAKVLGNLGNVHDDLGDFARSLELHRGCLAIAEELGDLETEVSTLGHIASVLWQQGNLSAGMTVSKRQLDRATVLRDPRITGLAHGVAGNLAWECSDLEVAGSHYAQFHELARQVGFRLGETVAMGNLAALASCLGQDAEAEERMRSHLRLSQEIGYSRGAGIAQGNLAAVADKRGDLGTAVTGFRRSTDTLRADKHTFALMGGLLSMSHPLSVLGDADGLRRAAGEALSLALEMEIVGTAWQAELLCAEADVLDGQPERAAREFRRIIALARDAGEAEVHAEASWRLARVLVTGGDPGAAQDALREALASTSTRESCSERMLVKLLTLHASLAPGSLAEAHKALARGGSDLHMAERMEVEYRLYCATGDRARLRSARDHLHRLATDVPEGLRDITGGVPLHRAIMEASQEDEASDGAELGSDDSTGC